VWKFYLHRTGPCPGACGACFTLGRPEARGFHGVLARGACFLLGPPGPTWIGVCPAHGACFTLGQHEFSWVGPLQAVRAIIHDNSTVTCKSPVTSAQFEINFHCPCQLCKEWPRNTSVSKMEPKESWWSDASATWNFSLVVKFSKTEIWIRHDSLPYTDEPNPNWFT